MSGEREIDIVKKAMAYDLKGVFQKNPDKTYSVSEICAIIDAYISGNSD